MVKASPTLVWGFVALGLFVGVSFVAAVQVAGRRTGLDPARAGRQTAAVAVIAAAWMGGTLAAAAAGVLSFTSRPPTMLVLLAAILVLALAVARSRLGERLALGLPLAALVGFQGFRVAVELLMHRAYVEGVMPVQMSYSGRNLDIVSGASALAVGGLLALGRLPRWAVRAWNWLGVALLANILVIALLSAPLPIRVFHNEPANVWVTQAPFVWLPAVMVLAAIVGHLLVFRRLRAEAHGAAAAGAPRGTKLSRAVEWG